MPGRTTVLALKYIVKALENPNVEIEVRDHHSTEHCHASLVKDIHDMATELGLEHVKCYPSRKVICFTNT